MRSMASVALCSNGKVPRSASPASTDQDHGGVALAVAISLRGLDELGDFGRRQVLPLAIFGVRPLCRDDCSVYARWRY
jgi:hypothetical protein